jgi:dolichol-phosphate mannosyltransferase
MQIRTAVVIPCFRVKAHILDVLARIGPEVSHVYVVDDACPEHSGDWVKERCTDPRVQVLQHLQNQGVGGAVLTGYSAALAHRADVLVKLDGDGQMDPALIPRFIAPIVKGQADYTKGNRFYDLKHLDRMPFVRLLGNAVLSFMAKLSTGYWNLFDINNGYTALHARVAQCLPFEKISRRYFFETDMLFRLNTIRALALDIPMDAVYGQERSNLPIRKILGEFLGKHVRNLVKRIFYNYFLRDMTVASLELLIGTALLAFAIVFGGVHWMDSVLTGKAAPLGTIMLAALTALVGLQMLLAFISFDVSNVPRRPIHLDLADHP